MKRPDTAASKLANIVRRLEVGEISPQDAMVRLLPLIMSSKTVSDLEEIEPVKDYILSWNVPSHEN